MKRRVNRDPLISDNSPQPDNKYFHTTISNFDTKNKLLLCEKQVECSKDILNKASDYYVTVDEFRLDSDRLPILNFLTENPDGGNSIYKMRLIEYQTILPGFPTILSDITSSIPLPIKLGLINEDGGFWYNNAIDPPFDRFGYRDFRPEIESTEINGTQYYSNYLYSIDRFVHAFNTTLLTLLNIQNDLNYFPNTYAFLKYERLIGFRLYFADEWFVGAVDPFAANDYRFLELSFNEPLRQLLNGFEYYDNDKAADVSYDLNVCSNVLWTQANINNMEIIPIPWKDFYDGNSYTGNAAQYLRGPNFNLRAYFYMSDSKKSLLGWKGFNSIRINLHSVNEPQIAAEDDGVCKDNKAILEINYHEDRNYHNIIKWKADHPVWNDLNSDIPLNSINLSVTMIDIFGKEKPIYLGFGEQAQIDLRFIKKQLINNYYRSDEPI